MTKKGKYILSIIIICLLTLFVCHLMPKTAIRAHLFTQGFFVASFSTGIVDDNYHNRVDWKRLARQHAKCYTLTQPPVERATKGTLANWKVKRVGIFYFVSYYGDI